MGIPGGYSPGPPSRPAASPPSPGEQSQTQRSGPVGPAGAGVVGSGAAGVTVGGDGLLYHPTGPVGPTGPSLYRTPQNAHLGPIGRDLRSFLIKLVKTVKCRRKVCKRPVIVPNIQNGSGKSPLGFLRFPFSSAFSRKELMGPF